MCASLPYRYILVLAAVFAGAGCTPGPGDTLETTGQIEAVTVHAGSRVGGRVAEVVAKEGDAVRKGDLLLRLDDEEAAARVAAARAQFAQAKAALRKAEAGPRDEEIRRGEATLEAANQNYLMALHGSRNEEIQAGRAEATVAQARYEQAREELVRQEELLEGGATPKRAYDTALHQMEQARATYDAALEKLDLLIEGTRDEQIAIALADRNRAEAALDELRAGTRAEDIDAARAARDAAAAQLEQAHVQLDEMTVEAPLDGVVQLIDLEPGDIVQPGGLVGVADPEDLELVVYVSARYLGRFNVGQEVELSTDSHGDRRFTATITYIASEGEFTPRNLQTEEERVQQVYGVKLAMDSADGLLRAGMTATVHLPLRTGGAGE